MSMATSMRMSAPEGVNGPRRPPRELAQFIVVSNRGTKMLAPALPASVAGTAQA